MKWNIDGEYITDLARSWFYEERRPYKNVEELLLSCMCGTDTSQDILKGYAFDILNFTKKFIGSTLDDSFCLVDEEDKNTKILRKKYPLYKYIDDLIESDKIPFEICEYGFIDTNGKYIPIEWCQHTEYASEWIRKNIPTKELLKSKHGLCSTDYMVYVQNWVLIENPRQEESIIHYNRLNKKQRETLYDYYMYYNRVNEAKELYENGEC